jgi:hypothetical protein
MLLLFFFLASLIFAPSTAIGGPVPVCVPFAVPCGVVLFFLSVAFACLPPQVSRFRIHPIILNANACGYLLALTSA